MPRPFGKQHWDEPERWKLKPAPSRTEVPEWLRRVTTKALSLEPAERFESMQALLRALERGAATRRQRLLIGVASGCVLGASCCVASTWST